MCFASGPLSRVLVAGSGDGVDQDLDDPRLRPVARLSGSELGVTSVSLNCIRTLLLSSSTDPDSAFPYALDVSTWCCDSNVRKEMDCAVHSVKRDPLVHSPGPA
jgi:hypothetical protein